MEASGDGGRTKQVALRNLGMNVPAGVCGAVASISSLLPSYSPSPEG
jgi:hypothetical protein